MSTRRTSAARRLRAAGFSLIELLVSMAIALVVTLAITSVMIRTGADRRTSSSVNDINQTSSYLAYVLDRAVRNAGSGFSQDWATVYGCRLNVARDGTNILPRPSAFGASSAFANVSQTVRLMPVLIGKGLADAGGQVRGDVLTVIGGTGGFGELGQDVRTASITTTEIGLQNTVAWRTGDLVLLADTSLPNGCMVQQVSAKASDTLTFGGTYTKATGTNISLTNFATSSNAVAVQLGGSPDNMPTMQLYGVGDNNTLFSHDLLRANGADTDVPIADGVVELRALYGLDTTVPTDGVLDSWLDPTTGSGYTVADLTDGSAAAQAKQRRIVAVRIGLILRTGLQERDAVVPTGTTVTLFNDLGLARTRTLTGTELNFRHRTVEVTVPLRNTMFAP
jgi:type IV pilus assembly protein PilW